MFNLLKRYLKDYWAQMLIIVVFTVGQAYAQTSLPEYLNKIMNQGVAKGDMPYIVRIGATMLVMTVTMGICMVIAGYFSAYVTAKFTTRIRADIFKKTQTFSDLDYQNFSKESLLSRATGDATQMQMVVINMLRSAMRVPFIAIFTFVRCVLMDAPLSLILGGSFVLSMLLVRRANMLSMPKFMELQRRGDRVGTLMNEKLTGARSIRAFSRQQYEIEKLTEANRQVLHQAVDANRIINLIDPLVQVIMNLVVVLILMIGSVQMRRGLISLSGLIVYIQYSIQLAAGFSMVMTILNALPSCEVSAARIREVLDYSSKDTRPAEPRTAEAPKGEIRFKDVHFGYSGARDLVLEKINLTIPAGKTTAIVGATGSGKSTLLKLIPQFYGTQFYGSILIDGMDTKEMNPHDLRKLISYAPQKAVVFSGTVESNLRMAKPDATPEDIQKACDMAMVTEYLEAKHAGPEFELTQGGGNLSGGQRQRISIARAFIKDAPVYLLDDTFSALDFKTDAAVRAAMYRELAGRTIVVVAQRISTIMSADQIVVLDKGRIIATGTHRELLAGCGVYREIYETQVSQNGKEAAS